MNSPHPRDAEVDSLVKSGKTSGPSSVNEGFGSAARSPHPSLKTASSWVSKRDFRKSVLRQPVVQPSTEDEVVEATAHAYSRSNWHDDDGVAVSVLHSANGAALAAMSTMHNEAIADDAHHHEMDDENDEYDSQTDENIVESEGSPHISTAPAEQQSGVSTPLFGPSRTAVSSFGSHASTPPTLDGNDWFTASELWRQQRSPGMAPSPAGLPLFRARCDSQDFQTRSPRSLGSFRRRSMMSINSDDYIDSLLPSEKDVENSEAEFEKQYKPHHAFPTKLRHSTGSFKVVS